MLSKFSIPLLLALAIGLVVAANAAAVAVGEHHAAQAVGAQAASREAGFGLIAPTYLCPGQTEAEAPVATQQEAMRCMVNFARRGSGLGTLAGSTELDRSADAKSGDIIHCDSFSHYACGRDFTFWMQSVGYIPSRCWRVGENLAWGTGQATSVRALFRALLHSPEHRDNILGHFSEIGVGLQVGDLNGRPGTHVWTQHFGSHC